MSNSSSSFGGPVSPKPIDRRPNYMRSIKSSRSKATPVTITKTTESLSKKSTDSYIPQRSMSSLTPSTQIRKAEKIKVATVKTTVRMNLDVPTGQMGRMRKSRSMDRLDDSVFSSKLNMNMSVIKEEHKRERTPKTSKAASPIYVTKSERLRQEALRKRREKDAQQPNK